MSKTVEIRAWGKVELRAKGDKKVLTGYAARFNVLSEDLGGFRERIAPGTFARAISDKQDVRLLVNHDKGKVIGRTRASTLSLAEDGTGLTFECPLPNTTIARDLQESIERGDLSDMSFGFTTVRDNWAMEGQMCVRELRDVDLFDVSVVTFAAYPDTSVAIREMADFHASLRTAGRDPSGALRRLRLSQVDAE